MRIHVLGAVALAAGISAFALSGLTGTAQQTAAPAAPADGRAPTVEAIESQPGPGVFSVSNDGPAARPNHPPIDSIPAMPFPDEAAAAARPKATGPTVVVGRDALTGQMMQGQVRLPNAMADVLTRGGGYGGADGGGGAGENERPANMSGSMSVISDATRATHPWRMNVKVVMRFGASYSVCSGTMRDAETILTAGHCVFDFGGAGWADEIWVYPGWDGVGPHFAPPASIMNPYGWARGTQLWSTNGWINSGDLEFDLGLIGVTRAVGMLTGWFGWEYGGDCGYWTSQTVNNASYPAEACPTAGLHTGRDMYYWSGLFNSCPGGRLQLTTVPGCTNAIWGGMSGSGVYRYVDPSRWVHAITSTSNRSTTAHYARQTQGWVEGTDNDVLPVVRGAAFDLQPLNMNAGATTVAAGANLGGLTHLAANATNGGANNNWDFSVYLSTNDDISTADTLLSTQNYNWNFGAMSSVTVNMGAVNIPGATLPGNYYVGVIYANATDGDSSNNDSDGWDAVPITVTKPDLDMTLLTAPATALPGTAINVSNTVQNIGNAAAGSFWVGFYLSTDAVCTTSDTFLTARQLAGGLGVGVSNNANTSVTIPGNTTLGAKFLCGIADDITQVFESNEGNNTISAGISIVQSNLRITSVAAPAQGSPGGVVTVANTVNNNGTAGAGAFRVGLYLSTDATCTTGDTFLTSRALASLGAGASSAVNTNVTIPAATPFSTRFVCAIADDLLAVAESSEADNTGSDSIAIVSPTPIITLKVNGVDAVNVPTAGPMNLTLSVSPTTYTASLSWYWAIVFNGSLQWVTSTGVSPTPAPFFNSPPVVLTDVVLLNLTLPAASTMTNAIFMINGSGVVVASDFITATRP